MLRKGDKQKQVLGWWLSRRTCVGSDWISKFLAMGHPGLLNGATIPNQSS